LRDSVATIECIVGTTGGTGSSVVVVKPPHPNYSDFTGGTVVQLNMVTIGGFNGLNS
jgi:hypothetical protein